MNMVNLQLDFYKRFDDAASRLIFAKSGYLLPLIGSPMLPGTKSLCCTLSMGVTVAARRLDSGKIEIESTDSNACVSYDIKDAFRGENKSEREMLELFRKTGFNGAQILYDTDIAKDYDFRPSLRAAVLQAVVSLNRAELPSPEEAAVLCGGGKDVQYYTALLSSKSGWCTYMDDRTVKNYPMPMTGLLILTVKIRRCRKPVRMSSLEKELYDFRSSHPSVFTYSGIKYDMLRGADYSYLPHIANENENIDNACKALKSCNISKFAELVNDCALSYQRCISVSDEQHCLIRIFSRTEGCLCSYPTQNGIYSIIDAEIADYIMDRVRDKFEERFGYSPRFALSSVI